MPGESSNSAGKEITVDPKTVVKEFFTSYERGDLDETWRSWLADDLVVHPVLGQQFTRQSWLEAEKMLVAALEDLRVTVLDQIAEGNKIATRYAITGRQTKEFFGNPSYGRTGTLTGTNLDIIKDDKIVEHWAELAMMQFLQQLRGS